jgi:YbbR domain-containing protein
VRGSVTVGMLDSSLRLKTFRAAMVEVQILPAPLERTFRGLPVHWRNLASNLTAQFVPARVDVTARGSREELNRLGAGDLSAYVDVSGLGAGEYSLPVRAESMREVGVTQIEPSMVKARIIRDKN